MLLQQQTERGEAAETLVREFALSPRQAYRYLEQAGALRGLPLGQIVTQALAAWLRAVPRRG